jgi:MmpS family membrane protein
MPASDHALLLRRSRTVSTVEKGTDVVRVISKLGRGWIPVVLVITAALSGFAMYRMHGVFGSNQSATASGGAADRIVPFNPKRVIYEIYGPSETVGSVSYLDENANPVRADFTTLPWTVQVSTTMPSMFANVVAQGDSDTLGCRITVNGQLREERSSIGHDAEAFCLVKAA